MTGKTLPVPGQVLHVAPYILQRWQERTYQREDKCYTLSHNKKDRKDLTGSRTSVTRCSIHPTEMAGKNLPARGQVLHVVTQQKGQERPYRFQDKCYTLPHNREDRKYRTGSRTTITYTLSHTEDKKDLTGSRASVTRFHTQRGQDRLTGSRTSVTRCQTTERTEKTLPVPGQVLHIAPQQRGQERLTGSRTTITRCRTQRGHQRAYHIADTCYTLPLNREDRKDLTSSRTNVTRCHTPENTIPVPGQVLLIATQQKGQQRPYRF